MGPRPLAAISLFIFERSFDIKPVERWFDPSLDWKREKETSNIGRMITVRVCDQSGLAQIYGNIDICVKDRREHQPHVSFPSQLVAPDNRTANKRPLSSGG